MVENPQFMKMYDIVVGLKRDVGHLSHQVKTTDGSVQYCFNTNSGFTVVDAEYVFEDMREAEDCIKDLRLKQFVEYSNEISGPQEVMKELIYEYVRAMLLWGDTQLEMIEQMYALHMIKKVQEHFGITLDLDNIVNEIVKDRMEVA